MLIWKTRFLIRKCHMLTRKNHFLIRKCPMLTGKTIKSETLVFSIRRVRHGDEEVYGSPFQELNKHTTRTARRWFDNVKR